jgi:hypothetical protein
MKIKIQMAKQIIHWATFVYYLYLFGYASLFKVFQKQSMMEGMLSFGFDETWTLFIGYGELIGVIGLLMGIRYHEVKNIAVLWLFPFAIGALMVHFAYHEYEHFYGALLGSISSVVLLATDKHFKLII